jgi:hypothetical protein
MRDTGVENMVIELTDDEALVLDPLLADYGTKDPGRQLRIDRAAERNALWALAAALEKQLVPPFQRTYGAQIAAARARVEEQGGSWES